MQDELARFATTLIWATGAGIALFLLRVVLAIALRNRVTPGLFPGATEAGRQDSMSRLISLIGYRAVAPDTLGTRRRRSTLGLKLLFWGVTAMLAYFSIQMSAEAIGPEVLILAFVVYLAMHAPVYEITYDRDTITLPRWWFDRTTCKWRDLDAAVEKQGWYLVFHFRDGTVIQAYKYVVGYAQPKEAARKALREV